MIELQKQGVLFTQNKTKKLEYQKKGSAFEIDIYDYKEKKKEDKIIEKGYIRSNTFKLTMNEKSFINYLQEEKYTK